MPLDSKPATGENLISWRSSAYRRLKADFATSADSLQSRILGAYAGTDSSGQILKEHRFAEKARRKALYKFALEMLAGTSDIHKVDFKKLAIRLVALNPEAITEMHSIFPSESVPELTHEFLIKVADEIKRRKKRGIDATVRRIPFLMAQNWTSPDSPLWLMSDKAGAGWLKMRFKHRYGAATVGNFATLVCRTGLKRASKPPIKTIEEWDGKRIGGFSVAGDLPGELVLRLRQLPECTIA